MYKWKIDIFLKGSNVIKHCVYIGPEKNSADVAMKLFNDRKDSYYVDLYGDNEKSLTYVRIGEIAAFDICEGRKVND